MPAALVFTLSYTLFRTFRRLCFEHSENIKSCFNVPVLGVTLHFVQDYVTVTLLHPVVIQLYANKKPSGH